MSKSMRNKIKDQVEVWVRNHLMVSPRCFSQNQVNTHIPLSNQVWGQVGEVAERVEDQVWRQVEKDDE